jgi:hypothetical protein
VEVSKNEAATEEELAKVEEKIERFRQEQEAITKRQAAAQRAKV